MAVKQLKKLGKKGMFLTFIAIAIIAAVIIIFTPSGTNLREDMPVIKTRASTVNEYVLDLQDVYLERALHATGRKALIALVKYVEITGFFPDAVSFEDAFKEVVLDGNIGDIPIDDIIDPSDTEPDIMTENTFKNWTDKINKTAYETFNVDTKFAVGVDDISIYQTEQTGAWHVGVEVDAMLLVTTAEETASWTKYVTIKTEISVENFDDPYYLVKTGGSYVNKIRQSGTKFDEWGREELKAFIRADGNYTYYANAPSFLMRFYNDVSASDCCGIESLVNPNHAAILNKDVSYVDYKYWVTASDCDNLNLYQEVSSGGINAEFSNIKFDFTHIVLYKLLDDPLADVQQICPP